MSNTPETDAELMAIKSVCKEEYMLDTMADFARKLELERDEARDTVGQLTKHGLDLMDANRMLKRKLKKLKENTK